MLPTLLTRCRHKMIIAIIPETSVRDGDETLHAAEGRLSRGSRSMTMGAGLLALGTRPIGQLVWLPAPLRCAAVSRPGREHHRAAVAPRGKRLPPLRRVRYEQRATQRGRYWRGRMTLTRKPCHSRTRNTSSCRSVCSSTRRRRGTPPLSDTLPAPRYRRSQALPEHQERWQWVPMCRGHVPGVLLRGRRRANRPLLRSAAARQSLLAHWTSVHSVRWIGRHETKVVPLLVGPRIGSLIPINPPIAIARDR